MREDISVREIGNSQYLISQENLYSFRMAFHGGKIYVSIKDIAECCGYRSPSKVAQFATVEKVKITTRSGKGNPNPNRCFEMWYMTVDDARNFVQERSMRDSFKQWFLSHSGEFGAIVTSNVSTVNPQNVVQNPPRPVHKKPEVPAAQPFTGVNISPEMIDQLVISLLTLKQGIISSATH